MSPENEEKLIKAVENLNKTLKGIDKSLWLILLAVAFIIVLVCLYSSNSS